MQNTVDSCLFCNRPLHANFGSVNNISDELKLCKPNIFGWNKHGWFLLVINHFMLNLEVQKNKSFTEVLEICPKQILLILMFCNQPIHSTFGSANNTNDASKYWKPKIMHKKIIWGLKHWKAMSKITLLRWHDMTVYFKQFEKFEPISQKKF